MATEKVIRDYYGRVIGYISYDDEGNGTARDFYRRILGWYDARLDTTKDFSLRVVARGDVTSGLIWSNYQEEEKKKAAK